MSYQFLPDASAPSTTDTIPVYALIFTAACLIPVIFIAISALWKRCEASHNWFLTGLRFFAIGFAYIGCWSTSRKPKTNGQDVEAGVRVRFEGDADDGTTVVSEHSSPVFPSSFGGLGREVDESHDFLCIPSL
ncbi:hypothetical protein F4776DRAFT_663740 [Hypoxylon sp. NC0597]|nr:hypothetical protein F4776DRAFT_663740 [Hypoxylon sp. NC0597]